MLVQLSRRIGQTCLFIGLKIAYSYPRKFSMIFLSFLRQKSFHVHRGELWLLG